VSRRFFGCAFDGWAKNGAKGWAFADVLPVFKSQEDWRAAPIPGAEPVAPYTSAGQKILTQQRQPSSTPHVRWE